jgi:type VI secretion system protein ImpM
MEAIPRQTDAGIAAAAVTGLSQSNDDGFAPTVILPASQARQPQPPPDIACWFGKLPFLGDFASRRLPESFIKPWDDWLQPGLAAARERTGDRWLDLYLTFPVWRFVVPAGLLGDASWIGVLLPSIDRVGRCFPLTICEPVARAALEEAGMIGIDLRLAALADAGIEALDADTVDFLEQRLAGLGPMRAGVASTPGSPAAGATMASQPTALIPLEAWLQRSRPGHDPLATAWPLSGTVPAMLAGSASRFVVAALRDRVLWWSPADAAGGAGALLLEPFPFSAGLLGRLIGTS